MKTGSRILTVLVVLAMLATGPLAPLAAAQQPAPPSTNLKTNGTDAIGMTQNGRATDKCKVRFSQTSLKSKRFSQIRIGARIPLD